MIILHKKTSQILAHEKVKVILNVESSFDEGNFIRLSGEFLKDTKDYFASFKIRREEAIAIPLGEQRRKTIKSLRDNFLEEYSKISKRAQDHFEIKVSNRDLSINTRKILEVLDEFLEVDTQDGDKSKIIDLAINTITEYFETALDDIQRVNYKAAQALSDQEIEVIVDRNLEFEISNVGGRKSASSVKFSSWSDSLEKRVSRFLTEEDDKAKEEADKFQAIYADKADNFYEEKVSDFSILFRNIMAAYEEALNPNSPLKSLLVTRHLNDFSKVVIPEINKINNEVVKKMDEHMAKSKITPTSLFYFNNVKVGEFLKMPLQELLKKALMSKERPKIPLNGIMSVSAFLRVGGKKSERFLQAGEASIAKGLEGTYKPERAVVVRELKGQETRVKANPVTHEIAGIIAPQNPRFRPGDFLGKLLFNTTRIAESEKKIFAEVNISDLMEGENGQGKVIIPLDYKVVIYRGTRRKDTYV